MTENFTQSVLEDAIKGKLQAKLEGLEDEKGEVKQRILGISSKIDELSKNQFQKSTLKQVLAEFDAIVNNSPMEDKRKLLKTIIEEVKITAKTGEIGGIFEFKIRGNGTVLKQWNEVVKQRGVSLTPRLGWLRR